MRIGLMSWVLLGLLVTVGCRVSPSRIASEQIQSRAADTSSSDRFALSELRDLPPWTSLHVFDPYTPTATINQRLGFEWSDANSFRLDKRDDIYLTFWR